MQSTQGDIREAETWDDWMRHCGHVAQELSALEGFAAVKKLSELTRDEEAYRALSTARKVEISQTIDRLFENLGTRSSELSINSQQILLLDLATLGTVFTSLDWRPTCPRVPVSLLNLLLDSLISKIRSLRGAQVGTMLYSLNKLQLRDADAYANICDTISDQLKSPGNNSWFNNPEAISKLLSGVALVASCIPSNIAEERAADLLRQLSATFVDLSDKQFNSVDAPWANTGDILQTLAELPPTYPVDRTAILANIAQRYTPEKPAVPDRTLAQLISGFSVRGFEQEDALKLATTQARRAIKSSRQDRLAVAAIAALAQPPLSNSAAVKELLAMECFEAARVSRAHMALAAQKGHMLSEKEWEDVKAAHREALSVDVPFSNSVDKECEALLRVALLRGDFDTARTVIETVLGWGETGKLRLWRAAPYVQAVAGINEMVFISLHEAVMKNLSELAHSRIYMLNRGTHICSLLASTVRFGGNAVLRGALDRARNNEAEGWFADTGGYPAAMAATLVRLVEEDGNVDSTSNSVADCAELIWAEIEQHGQVDELTPRELVGCLLGLHRCGATECLGVERVLLSFTSEGRLTDEKETQALLRAVMVSPPFKQHATADMKAAFSGWLQGDVKPEDPDAEPPMDLSQLTLPMLKNECKARGLKVGGKKSDLIERIEEFETARAESSAAAAPADGATSATDSDEAFSMSDSDEDSTANVSAAESELEDIAEALAAQDGGAAEALPTPAGGAKEAEQEGAGMTEAELSRMKVPEIKELLAARGLKKSGKKSELIDRLLSS